MWLGGYHEDYMRNITQKTPRLESVLKNCLYLFLWSEKVGVPCWGKTCMHLYASVHKHTHTLPRLAYLLISQWHTGLLLLEDSLGDTELLTLSSLPSWLLWIPWHPCQKAWSIIHQVFLPGVGLGPPVCPYSPHFQCRTSALIWPVSTVFFFFFKN